MIGISPVQRELLLSLLTNFIEQNSTSTVADGIRASVFQCQVCGEYQKRHRNECPVGIAQDLKNELED